MWSSDVCVTQDEEIDVKGLVLFSAELPPSTEPGNEVREKDAPKRRLPHMGPLLQRSPGLKSRERRRRHHLPLPAVRASTEPGVKDPGQNRRPRSPAARRGGFNGARD